MMQDLVDAKDLCDIMKAFETRLKQTIRWSPIKPNKAERIIE